MADKKPAAAAAEAAAAEAAAAEAAAAARPQGAGDSPPLPCPRCESINTKFCYYNNYNLSQPRHFCKACRRYWTHGGTLRNIPVGGATRKHAKRCRTSRDGAAPNAIPIIPITAPVPISSALPPSGSGSFTSLLSDGGLGMGWGLGYGYGFGLGYGSGHEEGGLGEVGGSGGDTWQIGIGGGGGGGGEVVNDDHEHHEQCFGWTELAIATSGKCAK